MQTSRPYTKHVQLLFQKIRLDSTSRDRQSWKHSFKTNFFGQNLASFDDKSSRSMKKWQPTTLLSPRFMLFLCFAKECFLHKTITSQHLLKEGGKEGTMCARE